MLGFLLLAFCFESVDVVFGDGYLETLSTFLFSIISTVHFCRMVVDNSSWLLCCLAVMMCFGPGGSFQVETHQLQYK